MGEEAPASNKEVENTCAGGRITLRLCTDYFDILVCGGGDVRLMLCGFPFLFVSRRGYAATNKKNSQSIWIALGVDWLLQFMIDVAFRLCV